MRDIVITLIVMIGCLYTLKKPYIGILLWSWLSYMNPHRMSYGFAYSQPFAQLTAIVLLGSTLLSRQRQGIPINKITITWISFILFMMVTTFYAFYPDQAWIQYIKVIKIQLIVFITMMLITDREKLNQLIWVIVLSIGYFSVKGGVFTILTGGGFKVWGPPESYIEDNNGLAIAVLMVIPLMIYLRQTSKINWVKHGLTFAIITSLFTVLGSQSRGALLAILAVAGFLWTKSKGKITSGFLILILGSILLLFMPESWYKRMDTINTYEEDRSAMGRINAWEYAYNAANNNLLGMGFESWSDVTFAMYAPNPSDVHAAHSIYFTVLADHGWIGLTMFISIYFMIWRKLASIVKSTSGVEGLYDIDLLARMLQVGIVAYMVGGAFLSLSYFDLPWHLISIALIIGRLIDLNNKKN
jgi:putative inorganic carbon (HCO3(-)) transporter